MRRLGFSGLIASLVALALLSPATAKSAGNDPYFGTDYDCAPIMTDEQAAEVTQKSRGVVESVAILGANNYVCTWSLGSKSGAITLIAQVSDLQRRDVRVRNAKTYCNGFPFLSKQQRALLCDAAEDMISVRTPRVALEAYTALVRATDPGSAKSRFSTIGGVRGYYVSGTTGGAITMITPGWTVVHTACLNLATRSIDRECSIDALDVVLRNFRLSKECDWDRANLSCTTIPGPVLKPAKKRR